MIKKIETDLSAAEYAEQRIVDTSSHSDDSDIEIGLRPQSLDEYVGQEKAKESLKIYIEAAKMRGEALDHVLLYGPPGLDLHRFHLLVRCALPGLCCGDPGVRGADRELPVENVPDEGRKETH